MARNVNFDFRRGGGSSAEILFGKVTLRGTMLHTVGVSAVLPAPTVWDLVNGKVTATGVVPTPAPVNGEIEWAYKVTVEDSRGLQYEYLVGVPDLLTAVDFISLPRYFETKPPLFGEGPQGVPGRSATIAIGTTTSGTTPAVTNSGTPTDAVLNFTLAKGDKGDTGTGVAAGGTALQLLRKNSANTATEWVSATGAAVGLGNVDNTSDANKPVSTAQATAIAQSDTITANTKLAVDAPSTYPEGLSLMTVRTSDGWPVVPGGHASFVRVRTEKPRGLNSSMQWATAYVTATATLDNSDILYRVSDATDNWGAWQTLKNLKALEGLFAEKSLGDHSPSISIVKKTFGTIVYNLITIHAGGKIRPGLINKHLNIVDENVYPAESREYYIDTVVGLSGGTIVNNASGLNHIAGVESGDGARVTLRGAQVKDGVARNDFPADTHWTGHEAVGILSDGTFKGYSTRRGDTVSSMVAAGVQNSFCFGPILVEEGAARDLSDPFWDEARAIVSSLNFIGQKPNGDVILVNAQGVSGVSGGTLANQTSIALNEGCKFAFSLDRGGSAQCWAGSAPIIASGDSGNRRLIADYLYTTAPIGSPIKSQSITIPLATTVKAVAGYTPTMTISKDGHVTLAGRINRIDDSLFGLDITVVALMPAFVRSTSNISGIVTGSGDAIRRWLLNGNDGYIRILGSGSTSTTNYLDLSLCQWTIN